MMVMYALERRHAGFLIAFACGCALSSAYGFLAGTWPFGVVEAIWAVIALRRYVLSPRPTPISTQPRPQQRRMSRLSLIESVCLNGGSVALDENKELVRR